jgi:exonuclease SbcD
LYKVSFDNLPDTLVWLEAHPSCFVEITYLTDEFIDANTRKAILKAHDGIVNLIPQLRHAPGQAQDELRAEDLSRDMESLFRLFYVSEKGQEPNAQLVELFKEVLSKTSTS